LLTVVFILGVADLPGWNGKRFEKNEAKGILVAALGVLARYYGYERSGCPSRHKPSRGELAMS
jgi:hypothetical protein